MTRVVTLLLLSVLSNTVAQLSLKQGLVSLGGVQFSSLPRMDVIRKILGNPFLLLWAVLLAFSMVLWLNAISLTSLSFAYPFLSLNIVLTALGSALFLKEQISLSQWMGIFLVVIGIFFVTQG